MPNLNEHFFPGLDEQLDWFYAEYGTAKQKQDGTFSYSITRPEFNKLFNTLLNMNENNAEFIYMKLLEDSRIKEEGIVARVIRDYAYDTSKRKLLEQFIQVVSKAESEARYILNNDYRLTLSDLSKILNLKNEFANKFKESIDHIRLPAAIRHRLSPKGDDVFYRQKLFFSNNSLENFIEDTYIVMQDMVSVKISGDVPQYLNSLLIRNQRLNSIAKEITERNEDFFFQQERKKLKKEEIEAIVSVVNKNTKDWDENLAPRYNMEQIDVHEKVSILDRKDDIRKELEKIKAAKVDNGKFGKVADTTILDSLTKVSYKKIPLELQKDDGTRFYIINYIRNSSENVYYTANYSDGANRIQIESGIEVNTPVINVSLPRELINENNVIKLLELMETKLKENKPVEM